MLKITLLPFNVKVHDRMEARFHSYGVPGESPICILKIQFKINSQVTMDIYLRIHISAWAWDYVRKISTGPGMSTVVPVLWPLCIFLQIVVGGEYFLGSPLLMLERKQEIAEGKRDSDYLGFTS